MQARSDLKSKRVIHKWRRQRIRLLVLAGRRKSGKDVFVEYVMKNYSGFKHYRIAEAPSAIARLLELPVDRRVQHALFGVNALLYPLLGESAYKRRVAKILDREKPKFAIVESVRTREEYEEFVQKRRGVLVGVTAVDRVRYERALQDAPKNMEKRDEGKMTFFKFMAKERTVIERDIDWIVSRAHFVIENNNKSRTPFYREVDKVMAALGFKKR